LASRATSETRGLSAPRARGRLARKAIRDGRAPAFRGRSESRGRRGLSGLTEAREATDPQESVFRGPLAIRAQMGCKEASGLKGQMGFRVGREPPEPMALRAPRAIRELGAPRAIRVVRASRASRAGRAPRVRRASRVFRAGRVLRATRAGRVLGIAVFKVMPEALARPAIRGSKAMPGRRGRSDSRESMGQRASGSKVMPGHKAWMARLGRRGFRAMAIKARRALRGRRARTRRCLGLKVRSGWVFRGRRGARERQVSGRLARRALVGRRVTRGSVASRA